MTSAALAPDFCAMSLSEISIEERSIISSLAATSNFSAVEFFPLGSLFGTLVATEIPECALRGAQITSSSVSPQELIDRLTKRSAAP
ncbi:hypothetical protein ACVWZZ_003126 [Bradyrhizobium sp. LM6.10]